MTADDPLLDESSFSGEARLFPLPDLVMFPHVVQPLHVFEPRYRELVEDALAGDKLIAMAVLAPGWEGNYEGRPPVKLTACLGRIATHQQLADGRYNLLLLGLRRIEIVEELAPQHLYRVAKVKLLEDVYPAAAEGRRPELKAQLMAAFRERLEKLAAGKEQLDKIDEIGMTLGTLTDLVGYTMDLGVEFKSQLLAETNVDLRASLLLERLQNLPQSQTSRTQKFPPDFSEN